MVKVNIRNQLMMLQNSTAAAASCPAKKGRGLTKPAKTGHTCWFNVSHKLVDEPCYCRLLADVESLLYKAECQGFISIKWTLQEVSTGDPVGRRFWVSLMLLCYTP